MKIIVRILTWGIVTLSLNACTVYYYSVLDTENENVIKNVDHDFVEENDSLLIAYCFYGENAPVKITVYNKSDVPLYVDWNSSALIIDDVATNYDAGSGAGNEISFTPKEQETIPSAAQFVPPHSKIEHLSLRLGNFSFEEIPKKQFMKSKLVTLNGDERNVYVKQFNEYVSPVRFRSYLTLYRKEKESGKTVPFTKEHRFYVAEVIRAGGLSPENFLEGERQQGDFFYVTREKGTSFAVAGVIALSVVGSVIAEETTISY
ncbi:MAG: hypothetical protein PHF73_12920 [Massilibacteroides sp.]|nr:hypothetical protein [Massilibacteroides sp.]MDD4661538.1 hypothetical protein [Massilibacteroides sp.]